MESEDTKVNLSELKLTTDSKVFLQASISNTPSLLNYSPHDQKDTKKITESPKVYLTSFILTKINKQNKKNSFCRSNWNPFYLN